MPFLYFRIYFIEFQDKITIYGHYRGRSMIKRGMRIPGVDLPPKRLVHFRGSDCCDCNTYKRFLKGMMAD